MISTAIQLTRDGLHTYCKVCLRGYVMVRRRTPEGRESNRKAQVRWRAKQSAVIVDVAPADLGQILEPLREYDLPSLKPAPKKIRKAKPTRKCERCNRSWLYRDFYGLDAKWCKQCVLANAYLPPQR